jgi:hypothetical protein
MTTRTSRRAVLAGAITMPIAAAVTPVPALAEADDAELLRLGADVLACYEALNAVLDVPQAEQRSAVWRRREIDANDRLNLAIDALCEAPVRTLRGLITKARVSEIDPDLMHYGVAAAIVDDLLAMGGVQS